MIHWLFLTAMAGAQTSSCDELGDVGSQTHVAWVSPLRQTVRGNQWIEVVRVADLREWIADNDPEAVRVLQALGMKGRRARSVDVSNYKITVFDVAADWMCRPIEGGTPGEPIEGVSQCEARQQRPLGGHRRGYTGCGYSLDTGASLRGLDVYRIRWSEAATQGFCVMPMSRFLDAE